MSLSLSLSLFSLLVAWHANYAVAIATRSCVFLFCLLIFRSFCLFQRSQSIYCLHCVYSFRSAIFFILYLSPLPSTPFIFGFLVLILDF